jgi:hypothetical protein
MDGGGQSVALLVVVLLILLALSSRTGKGVALRELGRRRGTDKDSLLGTVLVEKHLPHSLLETRIDPKLPEDFRKPRFNEELPRPQLEQPIFGGSQPPKHEEDFARNQAKAHRAKAKDLRWKAAELRRKAGELEAMADQEDRMAEKVWSPEQPPWRS